MLQNFSKSKTLENTQVRQRLMLKLCLVCQFGNVCIILKGIKHYSLLAYGNTFLINDHAI